MDHYERLGVGRRASTDEIRAAFRAGMRRHHPDAGGDASARELDDLAEAWRVLRNPEGRRAYDEHLREQAAPTAAPAYVAPTWSEHDAEGPPARRSLVVLVVALAIVMVALLIGILIGGFTQGPTGR